MKQGSTRSSFLALAGTALAFAGCWGNSDELCPGVVKGATYEVQIHKPTLEASSLDCHLQWGFEPGVLLLATVNRTEPSGTCTVGIPDLSGVPDWSFDAQPIKALWEEFLFGSYEARFHDCEAFVSLRIDCFKGSSGQSSECELEVNIQGRDGEGCPNQCSTSLAVTVTRQ